MRRISLRSISLLTVGCAVLALATPGIAQWDRSYNRSYDRSYDQMGRWQIARTIRQAENRSNVFAAMIDRNNDSRFGRIAEFFDVAGRRLVDNARQLEQQIDVVSSDFDSGNSYQVRSDLANALDTARRINFTMGRRDLNSGAERQWIMLRYDLNRLARAFNLQQV